MHFTSRERITSILDNGLRAQAKERGSVLRDDDVYEPLWEDKLPVVFLFPLLENELGRYNHWAMYDYDPHVDPRYAHVEPGMRRSAFWKDLERLGAASFSDIVVAIIVAIPDHHTIYVGGWGWPFEDDLDLSTYDSDWVYKKKTTMAEFEDRCRRPRGLADLSEKGFEICVRSNIPKDWIVGTHEISHPEEAWFRVDRFRR